MDNEEPRPEEKDPIRAEVEELANQVCDGTISVAGRDRLEEILRERSDLRSLYLGYLQVNAALSWRYRTDEPDSSQTGQGNASSVNAPDELQVSHKTGGSDRGSVIKWFCLLAAAAALIFVSWVIHYQESFDGTRVGNGTQFVGTLRDATGPVTLDSQAIDIGARIGLGSLSLPVGQAELVFDTGARLRVAGPVDLSIQSAQLVRLLRGDVAAFIPEAAQGFTLTTPTVTLIDLGTEFGASVEETGATEVQVFKGRVEVKFDDSQQAGAPMELSEGDSRRIVNKGDAAEQAELPESRLVDLALHISEPSQWSDDEGGNGHFYQLVLHRHPVTWQQAAVMASYRYFRGMKGHLATLTTAEEDEFAIQMLKPLRHKGVWIGMTDVLREGEFRWITGEPFEFTNWSNLPVQQPDDFSETEGHGGEDYGMFARVTADAPWAWNDLSIDSIHETISVSLVEYEPPADLPKNLTMPAAPRQWPLSLGGNGHFYQLVLALEPMDSESIRQLAAASQFRGVSGQLVVLESEAERQFVVEEILNLCGISDVMVGLESDPESGMLKWSNGESAAGISIERPRIPAEQVHVYLRSDRNSEDWRYVAVDKQVLPQGWFGYLVEFPTSLDSNDQDRTSEVTARNETWQETRQRLSNVLQHSPTESNSQETISRLQAAASEVELHEALTPLTLLSVSVNPESRVKIDSLRDTISLRKDCPTRFLIRVDNTAGITAPLNLTPIDLAIQPPARADWCTIDVVDNPVTSRDFTGALIEYKVMEITANQIGLREVRISADAGQGTQDLGFRATTDLLLKIEPQEKTNHE